MPSSVPLGIAEINRLSSMFFIISGLDLLDAINDNLKQEDKAEIIEWIYSFQVNSTSTDTSTKLPLKDTRLTSKDQNENFPELERTCPNKVHHRTDSEKSINEDCDRGGEIKSGFRDTCTISYDIPTDCGNIAMTYCALASLTILGDDLSRVNAKGIINSLRRLQLPDGSFQPSILGGESDMRFVYCVVATSYILNDWSGINIDRCLHFIRRSMSHEGAFGQCPGAEAHGGSTYCALASLKLMNKLDMLTKQEKDTLTRWCLNRFDHGFAGRPNKDLDVCYSFWIGACLVILEAFHFVDQTSLLDFMLSAQEERGGLGKVPQYFPDLLHTYLGIASMAFINEEVAKQRKVKLNKLDVSLNISCRARVYLYRNDDSSH